ncbi:MAG TPA: thioesterase family protein [Burkholderiales bacterium]|jgi:acyl-CoA thioester hydrolase|nr:thioesterase family protein [Burkholderiales bacterium]
MKKEGFPEGIRLVHTETMAIRWGDMDAMMHVNNTVYFRYMEQARIGWIETLGVGLTAQEAEGPVIANASCKFRRPLKYPGGVEVRLYAGRVGRSSLPTYYEMRRTDDPETVYAMGEALFVWISNVTGKPAVFPETVRRRLEAQA